ncbi:tetratricopeptide repeat protein [Subtercola endophyticus]|uniref:tetratricopeptide repeat protein n=1 Tax=Subtercola endophyticus TaxID=2895559 RepID=UPI001E2A17AD|nr:tetratricopeptide repeat protein [Subtercola endophyticus]UFS60792.1 tetratricopeptide repeat protein [Subtercola endophyticus]
MTSENPAQASDSALLHARTYLSLGKPADALRALAAHLATHPDDERGLCLASQAHLVSGEPARALEAAQRAAALTPENEWAWRLVALSYSKLGRHAEARAAAATALAIAPQLWVTHAQVAQVDIAAKRITAESRLAAREATRLAPMEPDAHLTAGNVALASHDWSTAESAFRSALKLEPGHAAARNNLSLVLLRQGKAGSAAAGFVDILATDPDSEVAVRNLRAVAAVALRHLHFVLWVAFAIVTVAFSSASQSDGSPMYGIVWSDFLALVAAVSGIVVLVYVLRLRRSAGARFGQFIRSVPRLDRLLTVWAGLLAVDYLLMVAACFTSVHFAQLLYLLAGGILVAGSVVVIVRRNRGRVRI